MSYTRTFRKTITVHYSGSVSYPASQNGGTQYYSGSTSEDVVFEVTVDTDPFDDQVDNVKRGVDVLTGAVVATEAAQVKNIHENSKKVGDTVIAGFFKTVKSDISQQIAELSSKTDALAVHLTEMMNRLRSKQAQMTADYQRISSRYAKIFTELDTELDNRIHAIDEPIFRTIDKTESVGQRGQGGTQVAETSVSAAETSRAHAIVTSTLAKKRALEALQVSHRYLLEQHRVDSLLSQVLRRGGESRTISTPYVMMEVATGPGTTVPSVVASPLLGKTPPAELGERLGNRDWQQPVGDADARAIETYYRQEVGRELTRAANPHARRVAELASRMFDLSSTRTVD